MIRSGRDSDIGFSFHCFSEVSHSTRILELCAYNHERIKANCAPYFSLNFPNSVVVVKDFKSCSLLCENKMLIPVCVCIGEKP